MTDVNGVNIQEYKSLLVFVDLVAGNLALDDLGKEAVLHGFNYKPSLGRVVKTSLIKFFCLTVMLVGQ